MKATSGCRSSLLIAKACTAPGCIGGGQVNQTIQEYAGADAYGKDAMAAVNLAQKWTGV